MITKAHLNQLSLKQKFSRQKQGFKRKTDG